MTVTVKQNKILGEGGVRKREGRRKRKRENVYMYKTKYAILAIIKCEIVQLISTMLYS